MISAVEDEKNITHLYVRRSAFNFMNCSGQRVEHGGHRGGDWWQDRRRRKVNMVDGVGTLPAEKQAHPNGTGFGLGYGVVLR